MRVPMSLDEIHAHLGVVPRVAPLPMSCSSVADDEQVGSGGRGPASAAALAAGLDEVTGRRLKRW